MRYELISTAREILGVTRTQLFLRSVRSIYERPLRGKFNTSGNRTFERRLYLYLKDRPINKIQAASVQGFISP